MRDCEFDFIRQLVYERSRINLTTEAGERFYKYTSAHTASSAESIKARSRVWPWPPM